MKSLQEQMLAYAAYHHDARNKISHFLGVPLVTFALFVFLGWLRFIHEPDVPFTGATLFYALVVVYYLCLDWRIALAQAPFTVLLLWGADRVSLLPFAESALIFAVTFVAGWIIQIVGHIFEGRRPALVDNVTQIFNAPLFLTVEALSLFGGRPETPSVEGR